VAICIELLRVQTDIDLLQEVAGVIANAAVCEEDGAVIVSRLGGIAPLMKHLQPSGSLADPPPKQKSLHVDSNRSALPFS
jgi:hypothetical protein